MNARMMTGPDHRVTRRAGPGLAAAGHSALADRRAGQDTDADDEQSRPRSRKNRALGIITKVASIAAVPTIAIGMAGPATAASGTPDDFWYHMLTGSVMWNDYNTDDPSDDYDNLIIADAPNDGASVRLIATNETTGKTYEKHAYRGETRELGVGNVRKGDKVHFQICTYNNGSEFGCSTSRWFQE